MRRPKTRADLLHEGVSPERVKTLLRRGDLRRVCTGVYLEGVDPPTLVEQALAVVVATSGVASHSLAGILHELDGVKLSKPFVTVPSTSRAGRPGLRKRTLNADVIKTVQGYQCTNGTHTLLDLAAVVNDLVWEQALESALRKKLTTLAALDAELPRMSRERASGVKRIRRVLALRPPGAPATGSILETHAVQLIRSDPSLPTPQRQVEVRNRHNDFVAYVDLAFPEHKVFLELDGGWHKEQPTYDAMRQTAVVAAMQWLPGRFNWDDITKQRRQTLRRLRDLLL